MLWNYAPTPVMVGDRPLGGFYGAGHGLARTELIFPIGSRMAVVGAYEIEEGTLELNEDGVAGVNGAMVAFADRQVYAADPDFTYARQQNEKPRRGASVIKDSLFLTDRKTK